MKKKNIFLLIVLISINLIVFNSPVFGIEDKTVDYRGVWVSSVYNLDFPSRKGLTEGEFKEEYLQLLDNVEALNLNSVIFQVRPKGDAFYKSDINPWSEYLTGIEGKAPGFDPLKWMIEETHKRDLEFRAWFNPFRVTTSNSDKSKEEILSTLSNKNWARQNPELVFKYEGKLYLNPGEEKVRKYVIETIMEVVENYDIDGVHLDDYFYPNKKGNNIETYYSLEEEISFNRTKGNYTNLSDWRRNNINLFVKELGETIKSYNNRTLKNIEFGISPFGIWEHKSINSLGSNTPVGSLSSYRNQFVDSRKWVKEEYVDYIAPQLYWTFDEKAAPYGELVDWWVDVVKGTNVKLYIGHGNYKKKEGHSNQSWNNPREISNQLKYNENYEEIRGDIYFRYKSLLPTKEGNTVNDRFLKILKSEHYYNKAITPRKWEMELEIEDVEEIEEELIETQNQIIWRDNNFEEDGYFLILRNKEKEGLRNLKIIDKINKVPGQRDYKYTDLNVDLNTDYKYLIFEKNFDK